VFESEELGRKCFDKFDRIFGGTDNVSLTKMNGVDVCEVEGRDLTADSPVHGCVLHFDRFYSCGFIGRESEDNIAHL
jgi:hypothetical protein